LVDYENSEFWIISFEFFLFRHGPTQTYTDRNHGIPGDLEVMMHASLQAGRPGSSPSNTGNWVLEKMRFVQKEVEKMGRCVIEKSPFRY
jgi:hypothetical protein